MDIWESLYSEGVAEAMARGITGSWSQDRWAEGWAKGRVLGMAKGWVRNLSIFMKKKGVTLDEALDFFEIDDPLRSAIIFQMEEHGDASAGENESTLNEGGPYRTPSTWRGPRRLA